jgi:TP901-1 family phage major tail protein
MAAKNPGRNVLLQVLINGVWTTLAGVRTKSLSKNGELVDTTNADSPGLWRELLAGGGVRSISISIDGVHDPVQSTAVIESYFMSDAVVSARLVRPGVSTTTGLFQFQNYQVEAPHNGAVTFSCTLESAGEVTIS